VDRGYRVVVVYREPSYELRLGKDRVYTIAYDVRAGSPGEAVRHGLDEFHKTARLSNVGWSREVWRTLAVPLSPEEEQRADFIERPAGGHGQGPSRGRRERRRKPRVA
jgi:hypothetical protein